MVTRPIEEILTDESIPLMSRIKLAYLHDNDYWEREDGFSKLQFEAMLLHIDNNLQPYKIEKRVSKRGLFGDLGEKEIYFFKPEIEIDGNKLVFFMKVYFYVEGNRFGVCVQSFNDNSSKVLKFNKKGG